MSIQVINQVWKYSKSGGSELLVLLAIADHINSEDIAWPSTKLLSQKTKISDRQIHRIIKRLEKSGELIVNRDKHYNVYQINVGANLTLSDDLALSKDEIKEIDGDIEDIGGDIQGSDGDTEGVVGDIQVENGAIATALKPLIINKSQNESSLNLTSSLEKDKRFSKIIHFLSLQYTQEEVEGYINQIKLLSFEDKKMLVSIPGNGDGWIEDHIPGIIRRVMNRYQDLMDFKIVVNHVKDEAKPEYG